MSLSKTSFSNVGSVDLKCSGLCFPKDSSDLRVRMKDRLSLKMRLGKLGPDVGETRLKTDLGLVDFRVFSTDNFLRSCQAGCNWISEVCSHWKVFIPYIQFFLLPVLPSILLSTALCRSGFCRASRFLSSLAQTMKAFMGRRILCSPLTAFPSTMPADTPPPPWVRSGLCPPELGVREILGSVLLMLPVPRPSGELQSPERFWSKPISESEAGLGVLEAQGPPRDTRPAACRRVSLDKLDSVKFIPEPDLDSTFFFFFSFFFLF